MTPPSVGASLLAIQAARSICKKRSDAIASKLDSYRGLAASTFGAICLQKRSDAQGWGGLNIFVGASLLAIQATRSVCKKRSDAIASKLDSYRGLVASTFGAICLQKRSDAQGGGLNIFVGASLLAIQATRSICKKRSDAIASKLDSYRYRWLKAAEKRQSADSHCRFSGSPAAVSCAKP